MGIISEFQQLFSEGMAAVTSAVDAAAGQFVRSRRILLEEGDDGAFTARTTAAKKAPALPARVFRRDSGRPQPPLPEDWKAAFRGSRVEAQVQSGHVMTCLLDFPSKAGGFLDGMIRAQIDRLTPWSANDAVFGWSPPTPAANERIDVMFAATSKLKVQPLLQFAQALDVASVAIYATASLGDGASARIKLFDQLWRSAIGATRIPRLLRAVLLSAGVAAAASLLLSAYIESSLQSQQGELQRQLLQRRAAVGVDPNSAESGLGLLAKRKQATPSSVMVLEAISRWLPDTPQ